jgi:hypothetical protein
MHQVHIIGYALQVLPVFAFSALAVGVQVQLTEAEAVPLLILMIIQ